MKRIYTVMMCAGLLFGLAACNDETVTPPIGGTGNTDDPTGNQLANVTWVMTNADMPSSSLKQNYERFEFEVNDQAEYSWKWTKKGGEVVLYQGFVLENETSFTHSNGNALTAITVQVNTINGQAAPGGWRGIYTYDDSGKLLLNVEPDVMGWDPHPEADQGIGSGLSGMESVYTFTKQ